MYRKTVGQIHGNVVQKKIKVYEENPEKSHPHLCNINILKP